MINWRVLKQNTAGFTLLELLVVILCASVITLAASGVLLFAMNSTSISADQAGQQNTARTVTMLLETLASKGSIAKVESAFGDWTVYRMVGGTDPDDPEYEPIMYYHAASESIFDAGGSVLMGDIKASDLQLETKDLGGLLTISITTEEGTYSTSVYSRIPILQPAAEKTEETIIETVNDISESESRKSFLVYALQAITSFSKGDLTTGKINGVVNKDWPDDTPWCASFIAWLMAPEENGGRGIGASIQGYEYGDKTNPLNTGYVKGYYDYAGFETVTNLEALQTALGMGSFVQPGDLVFFDWDRDASLDHIGIVAYIGNGYLYTIEGNSGGTIAIRRYRITDPVISGYRILPWITN